MAEKQDEKPEEKQDEKPKMAKKQCPEGHDVEVYEGSNPFKQGTAHCEKCGTRYPVKA